MPRLLLDENLSPRLVALIADLLPGSAHVRDVGLARADEATVWAYARESGFAVVSKDGDFRQMSWDSNRGQMPVGISANQRAHGLCLGCGFQRLESHQRTLEGCAR